MVYHGAKIVVWKTGNVIERLILKYNADPDKIGVIGNSMGRFTAAGVFTHNPSIKALVVFNGSCGWKILIKDLKNPMKYI